MSNTVNRHPSSYRDPSGFVFERNGIFYRQVNLSFKEHFDHFIQSGCYNQLVKKGLLLSHSELPDNITGSADFYKTLKPEHIPFISFPYEWSFDMLRDAALLTLQIARDGLQYGMVLKDATPFNVQWHKGRLVFIDTLSFAKYEEKPWIAYRQFCETFLGPLLIMHYTRQQLPELMLGWPNGIPLNIVSSMLPNRSRVSLHPYLHIHFHAKMSGSKNKAAATRSLPRHKLLNLLKSLELLVSKLKTPDQKTTWSDYYDQALKAGDYLEQKKKIIERWLDEMKNISTAIDLGANEGQYSKLLAGKNIETIATDFDPYCINRLYNYIKETGTKNIQPLVVDLANPSPATGVNNKERDSFVFRVSVDLVLALALIHHLAIGKNIPLEMIAGMFRPLGKNLVIEFVPKDDEKVTRMLQQKEDIYPGYTEEAFVNAFEKYYLVMKKEIIPGSSRILYLMKAHEG